MTPPRVFREYSLPTLPPTSFSRCTKNLTIAGSKLAVDEYAVLHMHDAIAHAGQFLVMRNDHE